MNLLDIVKSQLEDGLVDAAREQGIGIANQRYHQLVALMYTTEQTAVPDTYTAFLREHRGN